MTPLKRGLVMTHLRRPGVFVVNGDGNIQILDISNAPFARPDLEGLLNGIKFVRDNDYPIRGTHAGA